MQIEGSRIGVHDTAEGRQLAAFEVPPGSFELVRRRQESLSTWSRPFPKSHRDAPCASRWMPRSRSCARRPAGPGRTKPGSTRIAARMVAVFPRPGRGRSADRGDRPLPGFAAAARRLPRPRRRARGGADLGPAGRQRRSGRLLRAAAERDPGRRDPARPARRFFSSREKPCPIYGFADGCGLETYADWTTLLIDTTTGTVLRTLPGFAAHANSTGDGRVWLVGPYGEPFDLESAMAEPRSILPCAAASGRGGAPMKVFLLLLRQELREKRLFFLGAGVAPLCSWVWPRPPLLFAADAAGGEAGLPGGLRGDPW